MNWFALAGSYFRKLDFWGGFLHTYPWDFLLCINVNVTQTSYIGFHFFFFLKFFLFTFMALYLYCLYTNSFPVFGITSIFQGGLFPVFVVVGVNSVK